MILCADGLTGMKEVVVAAFPQTEYQRGIVHQVRNTLKYVAGKNICLATRPKTRPWTFPDLSGPPGSLVIVYNKNVLICIYLAIGYGFNVLLILQNKSWFLYILNRLTNKFTKLKLYVYFSFNTCTENSPSSKLPCSY